MYIYKLLLGCFFTEHLFLTLTNSYKFGYGQLYNQYLSQLQ